MARAWKYFATEFTGRAPLPQLDDTVLVAQVVTDRRGRVAAHVLAPVLVPVPAASNHTTWLQAPLRPAQHRFLREKVLPFLGAGETVVCRRFHLIHVGCGSADEAAAGDFTPEEWSRADFDPDRVMRCMPWDPHPIVWVWYEIVGDVVDGDGVEEEYSSEEEEDVAAEEHNGGGVVDVATYRADDADDARFPPRAVRSYSLRRRRVPLRAQTRRRRPPNIWHA